jgi:hypothetical protein
MKTQAQKQFPRDYEIVVRTGKRVNANGNDEAYTDHATVSIYLKGLRAYQVSIPHSSDITARVKSVTEVLELILQRGARGAALGKRLMAIKNMRKLV